MHCMMWKTPREDVIRATGSAVSVEEAVGREVRGPVQQSRQEAMWLDVQGQWQERRHNEDMAAAQSEPRKL